MFNKLEEEKQYELINKILDEEYKNKDLINHLRDIFVKKGLPINIYLPCLVMNRTGKI